MTSSVTGKGLPISFPIPLESNQLGFLNPSFCQSNNKSRVSFASFPYPFQRILEIVRKHPITDSKGTCER